MSHDGDLQAAVRTWRLPRFGLVGALVALVIIGGRRVMTGSLWVDEAWSLAAFRHLRLSYQASGGSMIGYYAMMWPWARVSQAIWWLRLPSLLAGLGTMAATYRIVHKLFGERSRLAWAACVVLLWSPIFLWKSSEVRPYALETLLIALCWLAVIELATNPSSSKWATVFLVCAIVGPWVHGLFAIQVVPMILAVLVTRRKSVIALVLLGLLVAVAGGLGARLLHAEKDGAILFGGFGTMLGQLADAFLAPPNLLAAIPGILALIGMVAWWPYRQGRSMFRSAFIPMLWVFVPLVGIFAVRKLDHVFEPRYLAPSAPGLAILIALGIDTTSSRIARLIHRSDTRTIFGGIVVALSLFLVTVQVQSPFGKFEDWHGASVYVARNVEPGDGIVFLGGIPGRTIASRAAFEAAWVPLHARRAPLAISPARPLGDVRRIDTYLSPAQVRARASQFSRVWYVDYEDMITDNLVPGGSLFPAGCTRSVNKIFRGSVRVLRVDCPHPRPLDRSSVQASRTASR